MKNLNYFYQRELVSLSNARNAHCAPSHRAHLGLAAGYAAKIAALREIAGAIAMRTHQPRHDRARARTEPLTPLPVRTALFPESVVA